MGEDQAASLAGGGAVNAAAPPSSCSPILTSSEGPSLTHAGRTGQAPLGQHLPYCHRIRTGRQLHTPMQWGSDPRGAKWDHCQVLGALTAISSNPSKEGH